MLAVQLNPLEQELTYPSQPICIITSTDEAWTDDHSTSKDGNQGEKK